MCIYIYIYTQIYAVYIQIHLLLQAVGLDALQRHGAPGAEAQSLAGDSDNKTINDNTITNTIYYILYTKY